MKKWRRTQRTQTAVALKQGKKCYANGNNADQSQLWHCSPPPTLSCSPSVSVFLWSWILLKSLTNVQSLPSITHLSAGPCGTRARGDTRWMTAFYAPVTAINKTQLGCVGVCCVERKQERHTQKQGDEVAPISVYVWVEVVRRKNKKRA